MKLDEQEEFIKFIKATDDVAVYLEQQVKNKAIKDLLPVQKIQKFLLAFDELKNLLKK